MLSRQKKLVTQSHQQLSNQITHTRDALHHNYSQKVQHKINKHKNQIQKKLPNLKQNTVPLIMKNQPEQYHQNKYSKSLQSTATTQQVLKTTNICFHEKNNSSKDEPVPWTVQYWLPIRSSTTLDKYKNAMNVQEQKQKEHQHQTKRKSQNKIYRNRDGQTLLKKNSLFLLNYITTKERKVLKKQYKSKQAPFIIDKVCAFSSVKLVRFDRLGREKIFMQNLKNLRQKRLNNHNLQQNLNLEPW